MSTYRAGRHELGQNFLTDRSTVDTVVDLVSHTGGPIVEIGSGGGALTLPLQKLGRPITAIEIDRRLAQSLGTRVNATTTVVHGDFLHHQLPTAAHTIVGNLPFHQTTAMLRRLLHSDHWTESILLAQWEVARRRAGVGGATMMTAQWWPWFDFSLVGRVPAAAFTPRPSVDGGLLTMTRRAEPLVDPALRRSYAGLVHAVFTGKGHGLHQILPRVADSHAKPLIRKWFTEQRFAGTALPRNLSARQWAELFAILAPVDKRR